ncbi:hypothetical protein [Anaeromyxobacter oryzae]|uniref:Tetratricopeptide repeat protein n=1 Tax=Anaeromyxobacter oryzae TaxID=2918170 RepID=A0ABM7WVU1_9BACT|nr:hypothetical protein [Anaeromyxobacter oryzae]BDG03623.1 hypothetical protein AMOR_26190 [Anaeromyxobacter oryzae]
MLHAAVALLGLAITATAPRADEHLLAGARLFREEKFAEALVEFRVAERLGAPGAAGYAAATLVKLDRPEQALEAFEGPGAPSSGRAPLLDYFHALACYDARLYLRADRLLAGVGARSGPRIAEQAARVREDIAAALAREPARESVDWYLARCDALARDTRPVLARAYCEEALALAGRRADRHGAAVAREQLAKLGPVAQGER